MCTAIMLNSALPVMSRRKIKLDIFVFAELNRLVTMKFRRSFVLAADAESFIALD